MVVMEVIMSVTGLKPEEYEEVVKEETELLYSELKKALEKANKEMARESKIQIDSDIFKACSIDKKVCDDLLYTSVRNFVMGQYVLRPK